jgi:cob(I)alamin adenosyltransferase
MATKIYTRTGDKGTTSLIGGTKVPKSHLRIEAYGTVDELNSFIGLLDDQLALAAAAAAALATLSRAADPQAPGNEKHLAAGSANPGTEKHVAASSQAPGNAKRVAASSATPIPAGASPDTRAHLLEIQDRLFTIGSALACDPEKETKLSIPDLKEQDIENLEHGIDAMERQLPPMKSFIIPGGHIAVSTAHIVRCVCRRAERCCVRMQEEQLFVEPLVIRYLNRLSDYFFVLARYTAHLLGVEDTPWKPRT